MKNNKRWFLGFCSTLLLAVGLVRAADTLDPINQDLTSNDSAVYPSPNTTNPCDFADE